MSITVDPEPQQQKLPLKWTPPAGVSLLSDFSSAGGRVLYLLDEKTRSVGLMILPEESVRQLVEHRAEYWGNPAWTVDSLVHLKCVGDAYPQLFCQGKTMRNSASTAGLRYVSQNVEKISDHTAVVTVLENERGYRCEHRLSWRAEEAFFESEVTFINTGKETLTLEMLSSFSLGGMTPFAEDDAAGRLVLHRLRSGWCVEGRLESRAVEDLQLEGFHYPNVATAERFGQVGSMPVRGWFPFAALEDKNAGVFWGAQLAQPGSWQMEVYRRDDMISLSGGLADRELGHWTKTVAPGESFVSPVAILATARGSFENLCRALLAYQERGVTLSAEEDLPIVFNEWCTHWGKPTQEKIEKMAGLLQGSGVRYLVIDAGWYEDHGSWLVKKESFPDGMKKLTQKIRDCGMVPGIWFEFETCMSDSPFAQANSNHVLKRDGIPLASGQRWFWDFRDPWVHEYLSERVIGFLEENGFGYIKIDYNDTIGIGCEGAESLGEGLSQHLEGVQRFWKKIRQRLPDLVMENCSSGGHRLEPSMMALADMASFSDAHEVTDIPIVAANLHRAIMPRKSQIWAVIRPKDDERRLVYSLAATLLGRMALSGDLTEWNEQQWKLVRKAISFYQQAARVIGNGVSQRFGPEVLSYRNPAGWQAVLRSTESEVLVVCHQFDAPLHQVIDLELPGRGSWCIRGVLSSGQTSVEIRKGRLECRLDGPWSACAVLLGKSEQGLRL